MSKAEFKAAYYAHYTNHLRNLLKRGKRDEVVLNLAIDYFVERGTLADLQWLDGIYHLTVDDLGSLDTILFRDMAIRGYLDKLKWYHSKFRGIKLSMVDIYRNVLHSNQIEVLQWLNTTFTLTKKEVDEIADIARPGYQGLNDDTANWMISKLHTLRVIG